MTKKFTGIDVSSHQKTIVWADAAPHIDFAIIRAGYGKNNIDSRAETNVTGCIKYNIPFGLYWFSYAYTPEMARQEARYLIEFAKGSIPLMPLYYDFEYDSAEFARKKGVVVTPALVREMATAFCDELEANGYYAGIYCNGDYAKNVYGDSILSRYDVWYADWTGDEPDRKCNLWQNSDRGSVPGISGKVDTDVAFIDYPSIIKEKELNGYKKPAVKEEPVETFVCPHKCPYCPHSNAT